MESEKLLSEEKYQKNNVKVKKVGKILLIVGGIVLVLGVVSTVLGFMNLGNTTSNMSNFENSIDSFSGFMDSVADPESDPDKAFGSSLDAFNNTARSMSNKFNRTTDGMVGTFGWMALGMVLDFVGISLMMTGGVVMFVAHRREIAAYGTQQMMPVAKEGIEKITPTVANAAGDIAKSVSKGIKDGKKDE